LSKFFTGAVTTSKSEKDKTEKESDKKKESGEKEESKSGKKEETPGENKGKTLKLVGKDTSASSGYDPTTGLRYHPIDDATWKRGEKWVSAV